MSETASSFRSGSHAPVELEFCKMWFSVVAWIVLVGASAFFAGAALNLSPAEISIHFAALPGPQRFALGAILFTTLALIGSSVWQAFSLARQNKLLRDRLKGLRQDTLTAHETQTQFDAGVRHLVDSDPQEAIASIEKALIDTEQRAALAHGQSESVDMRDRLDDIRRRQKALREAIGVVAEARRVTEPVFGELKDRQRQLERWLTDLEIDDSKNSVADRLKDLTHNVAVIHERKSLLQESLATLNRFREELQKTEAELVPLSAPDAGIDALIADLRVRSDQLTASLDQLESSGDENLGARVEALSRDKIEIVQRFSRLDDGFNILDSIRLDFDELRERRAHLERALAEVETDPDGKSLIDRQNELNEFIVESRLRLTRLQDSSATLTHFKEGLVKSQAELAPLQSPVFGIEALIREVNANRDILIKTLGEIEFRGDEKLGSRVEALSRNKAEVDERLAHVFENFQKLDSMRKDIGEIFTSIRGTLNRIG
jgi:predicted  nucleic acid-binding Zn-ribbon protein